MKLIHLTDTHLVAGDARLYGLDPAARLNAAVADIRAHHADAVLAVVTGDLTHWGEPAACANLGSALARLPMPWVAMVGNHDRRAACLEMLAAAPRDGNGFVQGWHDTAQGRCLFLDTLDEGSEAGKLCDRRLAWLEQALATAPASMRFLIFMHHPPFRVGLLAMDQIALADSARFAAILEPFRARIRHLFFGHLHRPLSGSWRGIPFSTLRGTNHQVWFDLEPHAEHLTSHEPPAYGVVLIDEECVIVHAHDYLDASPRRPFAVPGLDERAYAMGAF
jgi:3',5'-cyclic AMP phosphodiesterase CpdA